MEELAGYLIYRLENPQAAEHFLTGIDKLYVRLERNPYEFAECRDFALKKRGYRKADISDMNYLIIFRVEEETNTVYVLGIFHGLENYKDKL